MSLRSRKNEKGAALVEMALVLPILMMLVFGIIEFGWMLRAYQAVGQCAREGARSAALGADEATVIARVKETGSNLYKLDSSRLVDGNISVTSSINGSGATQYTAMKVEVEYDHPFITGSLFRWLNNNNNFITLKQGAVMRKEE